MIKHVVTITILLFGFQALAQLTVRNNAYVFVTDEVLYVTDDVNLQENTQACNHAPQGKL